MITKTIRLKRRLIEIKLVSRSEMVWLLGEEGNRGLIERYQILCVFDKKSNSLLARIDCVGPSLATYDEYLASELKDMGFTKSEISRVWREICHTVLGI
jgi:hypothetical protein